MRLTDSALPEILRLKLSEEEGAQHFNDLSISHQVLHRAIVALERLANHFDPPPTDKVGTPYIADQLGCTTDYVAVMVRERTIPISCIVPGTGNGKPWRFFRSRIDHWIEHR